MILYHYSYSPIGTVAPIYYEQELNQKPEGFWVSCEGIENDPGLSWRNFWIREMEYTTCEGEENRYDNCCDFKHRIHLHNNINLLILNTVDKMEDFSYRYASQYNPYRVDWPRISENYQGILIYPYFMSLRLEVDFCWYYGWDCASGCIWDTNAIQMIEFIKEY